MGQYLDLKGLKQYDEKIRGYIDNENFYNFDKNERDTKLKWIDGKNIYQKSFIINISSSEESDSILDSNNYNLINGSGLIVFPNQHRMLIPFYSFQEGNSIYTSYIIQKEKNIIFHKKLPSNSIGYITIQYTKN